MDPVAETFPGYDVPGWPRGQPARAIFSSDGSLPCSIPGCTQQFNETHGPRYTIEKWKAHIANRDMHYYLWYDAALCFQPRALKNTFIRIDQTYSIAVCHYRREQIHPRKLEDHCRRCRGCHSIDKRFVNETDMKTIGHVSEQCLLRDRLAVQGFEACEAYYCCNKLYGPSQQGIHSHLKSKQAHNVSNPVKCMRYRTSRHGYAYIPINEKEYDKLNNLSDTYVVAQPFQISAATTEQEEYSNLKNLVLQQGYGLFQEYYRSLFKSCLEQLNNVTWNLHSKLTPGVVHDAVDQALVGYSFLTDPRNKLPTHGLLWHEIINNTTQSTAVPLFIRQVCMSDGKEGSTEAVQRYLDVCNDLTLQLMVLVYTALPIPPQSIQTLFSLTHVNSEDRGLRNLVALSHNRIRLSFDTIKIKLPRCLSQLLLRFLLIIRPMQIQLMQKMNYSRERLHRLSIYIFCDEEEDKVHSEFSQITSTLMKLPVNQQYWARLLHEMCVSATQHQSFTKEMFSEGWFNTTGLNAIQFPE